GSEHTPAPWFLRADRSPGLRRPRSRRAGRRQPDRPPAPGPPRWPNHRPAPARGPSGRYRGAPAGRERRLERSSLLLLCLSFVDQETLFLLGGTELLLGRGEAAQSLPSPPDLSDRSLKLPHGLLQD